MKTTKLLHKLAIFVGVMWLILSGCSVKEANIAPEGLLSVLGPSPSFSPEDLPTDWVINKNGNLKKSQLRIVNKAGKRSLKITNAEDPFIIVRRINAMMLATPFLSWSWLIEPQSPSDDHPVRIVIGFYGGDPRSRIARNRSFRWLGNPLPKHNRLINFTWGESALQRGTLKTPTPDKLNIEPAYTVRGGRENTGSWWLETVDVSTLYRQIWPEDNTASVRIVFIGIAAVDGSVIAPAHISGITLSR
jgi:hypothetical protein